MAPVVASNPKGSDMTRSPSGQRMAASCAVRPFRGAASNDRSPPFAMFCRRLDQCPLRADTKPSPTAIVRPLSCPFPPFGQRSLSAQLRPTRQRSPTPAILKGFGRPRRRDALIVQMGSNALTDPGRQNLSVSRQAVPNSNYCIRVGTDCDWAESCCANDAVWTIGPR